MEPIRITRQYGLWDSPVTPLSLSRGLSFSDVAWDESGALVWRESRPDRNALVVQPADGQAMRDLNNDLSVRAGVGYGGGDFCAGKGQVFFVEAKSGRLYRQQLDCGTALPITPAFGAAASPCLSPDGRWLLFVHTYEGQDTLAIVDSAGKYWPARLARNEDFYMQPAWHPDGLQIAWIAWNHPDMPWDSTWLRLGRLSVGSSRLPTVQEVSTLAGGDGVSVFQPRFSPDGRWLAYAADPQGWWHVYLYDLQTGEHRQLTRLPAEHAQPAWGQGMRSFDFAPDSKTIIVQRIQDGTMSLWQVDLETGQGKEIILEGYSNFSQVAVSPDGQKVALIASGNSLPPRLITRDLTGRVQVCRRSTSEELSSDFYSPAQHITWRSAEDEQAVYGLFYLPCNPRFAGVGLPPLVVMVHGGPTGVRLVGYDAGVQFFTSRGYAVLNVNYRGSSGYGRAYRNLLQGKWGVYDVQDAVSGARYLVDKGLVDGKRLVIMGGSAGGYTVLKTLVDTPGFFKAGVCLYGISNLFTLAAETHKFEAHYFDRLIGTLPEAADIYRLRSPLFFADRISDPLVIFHGEADVAVPHNQSDEIVASLRQRGVPHEYHLYPGEGHGFRNPETIEHLYTTIDKFLRHQVLFI
jgi:dipeptidyl aminopeptidase/acylaminoacyl peptidase